MTIEECQKFLTLKAKQMLGKNVHVHIIVIKEPKDLNILDTIRIYGNFIANAFDISYDQLMSHRRNRPIADGKKVLQYLLRKKHQLSLKTIGRLTGGYDHSSVVHNLAECESLLESDKNFLTRFNKIILKVSEYETEKNTNSISEFDHSVAESV